MGSWGGAHFSAGARPRAAGEERGDKKWPISVQTIASYIVAAILFFSGLYF